jgi:hypothetical protein
MALSLNKIHNAAALTSISTNDAATITSKSHVIGAIVGSELGHEIIGSDVWKVNSYGKPHSSITSDTITSQKKFIIPTIKGASSNKVILTPRFLKDNWDTIAPKLPKEVVEDLTKSLHFPVASMR